MKTHLDGIRKQLNGGGVGWRDHLGTYRSSIELIDSHGRFHEGGYVGGGWGCKIWPWMKRCTPGDIKGGCGPGTEPDPSKPGGCLPSGEGPSSPSWGWRGIPPRVLADAVVRRGKAVAVKTRMPSGRGIVQMGSASGTAARAIQARGGVIGHDGQSTQGHGGAVGARTFRRLFIHGAPGKAGRQAPTRRGVLR